MIECRVEQAERLKEFTDNHCAQASFFFARLLKNKDIKVNGKKVSTDVLLKKGDVVCYYLTQKQEGVSAFYPVYEDENVCIVDKESGVNSQAVHEALLRKGTYYFVHRLDRNTKGLLVFAKTQTAEQELLSAFRTHTLQKIYHALCFGVPKQERATLTAYLKKDGEKSLVRVFEKNVVGAEKIITEYSVLQTERDITKMEIRLHTGKTHQIRAHMAFIGCPVVGDMKYGNTLKNKAVGAARQCLVAKHLRFSFVGVLSYLNERSFSSRFEVELPKSTGQVGD